VHFGGRGQEDQRQFGRASVDDGTTQGTAKGGSPGGHRDGHKAAAAEAEWRRAERAVLLAAHFGAVGHEREGEDGTGEEVPPGGVLPPPGQLQTRHPVRAPGQGRQLVQKPVWLTN
jgi:hypothetical protein